MTAKNYLILCAGVSLLTAAAILLVPGLAEGIEAVLLTYLSGGAA